MKVETIVVGPLDTNCYIIEKQNDCLIIDPGDEFEKINKYITDFKLNVKGILITHYHFDHIQALNKCENTFECPIIDYKNKQKIPDFNYEIIETKGHHFSSVTFYFKQINSMFVGDLMFKGSIGRTDLEGANEKDIINSLKKIIKFEENIKIYPATENILENSLETICNRIENNKKEYSLEDIEIIKEGNYFSKINKYFNEFYIKSTNFLEYIKDFDIFIDEK